MGIWPWRNERRRLRLRDRKYCLGSTYRKHRKYPRLGSNQQPSASEADALSNCATGTNGRKDATNYDRTRREASRSPFRQGLRRDAVCLARDTPRQPAYDARRLFATGSCSPLCSPVVCDESAHTPGSRFCHTLFGPFFLAACPVSRCPSAADLSPALSLAASVVSVLLRPDALVIRSWDSNSGRSFLWM
jgi:hypothetical protein